VCVRTRKAAFRAEKIGSGQERQGLNSLRNKSGHGKDREGLKPGFFWIVYGPTEVGALIQNRAFSAPAKLFPETKSSSHAGSKSPCLSFPVPNFSAGCKAHSSAADNQCAGANPLASFLHKPRSGHAHFVP
jgi:hypothetical protein